MIASRLLVANRGEIAIRVMHAAADLGIHTVAVFSEDDAESLHTRKADEAHRLSGAGVPAYLDIEQLIAAAKETGCDAVHPGYGFLSENAGFARRCAEEGITFVGPRPETLELFGDKVRARAAAEEHGVPVLPGTSGVTSLDEAQAFFASLGGAAMIIKAIAGGGGRGVRIVREAEEIKEAHRRSQSEATAAFGNGDVYVERLVERARHIEVQIFGDSGGAVSHLGERDCSIQRRHQKLVEIAPAPGLDPALRDEIIEAAVKLASAVGYNNVGTFEFLVESAGDGDSPFVFMEVNPRLQVEHTVTEEVTGVDIVQLQLRLAGGASLAELGLELDRTPQPRGFAVQARVNMETMQADGTTRPAGGLLEAFEAPLGRGVRVDSFGYAGYQTSARFDSLLAKVIAHTQTGESGGGFAEVLGRTDRALSEFRIEGVNTNIAFLQALLQHPDVQAGRMYTRFVDDHMAELVEAAGTQRPGLNFEPTVAEPSAPGRAGATVDVNYGGGRVARFRDQIITTAMSAGGDSGSIISDRDNKAVGLLYAGSPVATILNQIQHVRTLLQIEVV